MGQFEASTAMYAHTLKIQTGGRYVDTVPQTANEKNRHVVEELTEHQLLLLHPETWVYGLKLKQWNELQTIRALSNRQNGKTKQRSADFIEGKGSGQIILLHGPPGVGKTYTVEAISEWLHRPLLALTVADIGTVETCVEQELLKWFDLAEAWNAVLFVDEADIFLERRQNRDLGRNGLVSAFLRRMEYFKGLSLTTNRVGQIDDAFISRVHIAIGYNTLNGETRKKIWNGFLQQLARERAGKIQIAPDAKKWVLETTGESQVQLNGRDIRNALQTAITLAEFECEEDPDYSPEMVTVVTQDHFQRVLEMSNRFHNYVTSVRREDERRRAQCRGDRNDYDACDAPSNQLRMLRGKLTAP
ncbi:P-loop containing nucleoside triphosphate hydrolase protein [Aspergillus aurantiobrunneus]